MPDPNRFLHGPFALVEEEITAFDLPVTGLRAQPDPVPHGISVSTGFIVGVNDMAGPA